MTNKGSLILSLKTNANHLCEDVDNVNDFPPSFPKNDFERQETFARSRTCFHSQMITLTTTKSQRLIPGELTWSLDTVGDPCHGNVSRARVVFQPYACQSIDLILAREKAPYLFPMLTCVLRCASRGTSNMTFWPWPTGVRSFPSINSAESR